MEKENTKQRILTEALHLFSQNGYEAVSVEQIASAVGIKAPSLYKHYKSKRDIFDAVFTEMRRRADAQAAQMNLHIANGTMDQELFGHISAEDLVCRVEALVEYSLHDRFVSQCRKLMTLEQYQSPEMAALYTERYVTRMLDYHETLFCKLIANGTLRGGNARSMAWQYVSPILVLLSLCDRQPEKEAEAKKDLAAHIRQFQAAYQKEELT